MFQNSKFSFHQDNRDIFRHKQVIFEEELSNTIRFFNKNSSYVRTKPHKPNKLSIECEWNVSTLILRLRYFRQILDDASFSKPYKVSQNAYYVYFIKVANKLKKKSKWVSKGDEDFLGFHARITFI